jgi:2,4'-dihydroxyacetophenone dioxygenase
MSQQLKRTGTSVVTATKPHKPAFFNPETLPWAPWVMEGTYFKLLNVNPISGGFTMLLKVEPNNFAPVHGHLGSVEGILLQGGFGYGDDRGREGWYVYEGAGIRHEPDTDSDGMIMFAVVYGPLAGYNDDGSVAAVLDGKAMYELYAKYGSVAHIDKPADW